MENQWRRRAAKAVFVCCVALNVVGAFAQQEVQKAESLKKKAQYDEAIQVLTTYLASHPKDGRAHYLLGWSYIGKGDKKSAIPHLQEALKLDKRPQDIKEAKAALSRLGASPPAPSAGMPRQPMAPGGMQPPGPPGAAKAPAALRGGKAPGPPGRGGPGQLGPPGGPGPGGKAAIPGGLPMPGMGGPSKAGGPSGQPTPSGRGRAGMPGPPTRAPGAVMPGAPGGGTAEPATSAPPPEPTKPKLPWPFIAAGLAALLVLLVVVRLAIGGKGKAEPAPSDDQA